MQISASENIGGTDKFLAIRRWAIFTVLAASYIWVYFHRMAPAVVSTDLKTAFGITAVELGSLAAMYYYVSALTQIPSGVLADAVGTRLTVTIANLIAGAGAILFGLATTFGEATLGRFLVGLGVSVVFVCFMKSNSAWFSPRQYGLISGLTLLIGNLGSVVAGSPLEFVIQHYSWRSVFVVIGIVSIILSVLSAVVIRNSPSDTQTSLRMPAAKSGGSSHAGWLAQVWLVLKNPHIWPSFIVNFGLLGGFYSFSGLWAVPFLHDVHHLQRSGSASLITASLVGLAVGSFCLGWLSDLIGRRKPILLGSVLSYALVLLALMKGRYDPGGGAALFFLLGFSCGGFVLTYAIAKDVVSPSQAGMAVSVVNTGVFVGASFIQSAYGWILDRKWDGGLENGIRIYPISAFDPANFFMLAAAVMALAAAVLIKDMKIKN
jgi:sugar phosphate permease